MLLQILFILIVGSIEAYKPLNQTLTTQYQPQRFEFDSTTNSLLFGGGNGGIYRAPLANLSSVTVVVPANATTINGSPGTVSSVKLDKQAGIIYASLYLFSTPYPSRIYSFNVTTGAKLAEYTLPKFNFDLYLDKTNGFLFGVGSGYLVSLNLTNTTTVLSQQNPLFSQSTLGYPSLAGLDYDATCGNYLTFNGNSTLVKVTMTPGSNVIQNVTAVSFTKDSVTNVGGGIALAKSGTLLVASTGPSSSVYVVVSTDCWKTASIFQTVSMDVKYLNQDYFWDVVVVGTDTYVLVGTNLFKVALDDFLTLPQPPSSASASFAGLLSLVAPAALALFEYLL